MTWTIGPGWTTTSNPFGSVSFNGTNQYLNTTGIDLTSVSVFTVEAWIYLTAAPASQQTIVTTRVFNAGTGWEMRLSSARIVQFYFTGVTWTGTINSTTTIALNTWYHVAFVRNGSSATLYVNGNAESTVTGVTNGTAGGGTFIGNESGASYYFNGNITNLRIVSGVAVYTGAFNVPQAPLLGIQPAGTTNISAITGTQTKLLLQTPNNASFLVDSSANNYTITNNGTATASALTPFVNGGGSGWSYLGPANGSASFDGSSQYLTTPVNATAFNYAAGGMTWEAWVNPVGNYTTGNIIFSKRPSGPTTPSQIEYQGFLAVTTGYVTFWTSTTGGVTTSYSSNITLTPNTWSHVAWVIDTTPNVNIYINGVSVFSAALTPAPTVNSEPVVIGGLRGFSGYFGGYISNFRMVKGVAVYTSNFTPPIRQLPAVQEANVYGVPSAAITGTQTSLLLNTPNNSQNTVDTSTNNFAITNTGSTPPSGINPFVPDLGSVSFNGSTQYLSIANNAALNPAAVDFTLEAWVYITSYALTNLIYSVADSGGGGGTGSLAFGAINTTGRLYFAVSTTDYLGTTGPIVPLNSWNHIALVRSGTTYTVWLNGSSSASTVQSLNTSGGGEVRIGRGRSTSTNYFNGYISNFRMVKGVAVYTTTFTPSTQPLPATQSANVYGNPSAAITGTQTSLLLNTPNNALFIADSSTNDFTMTNNGTAVATSLTPFTS